MKPFERMKHLRKYLMKLTQEEFSSKINISRSNYANIEKGSVNLTERVIADTCRAFSVNRDWLVKGSEPVFLQEHNELLIEIIRIYESLNEDNRKYLRGYVDRLLEEQNNQKD